MRGFSGMVSAWDGLTMVGDVIQTRLYGHRHRLFAVIWRVPGLNDGLRWPKAPIPVPARADSGAMRRI